LKRIRKLTQTILAVQATDAVMLPHARDIRLWPLAQKPLSFNHVVHRLGNIRRVISHALQVLGAKKQMNT
jgi:hypothetical protein